MGDVWFVASPKWYIIENHAFSKEGILLFRKYAAPVKRGSLKSDLADIRNLMIYGCQKSSRYSDYVQWVVPKWVRFNSLEGEGWVPKMDLSVSIDEVGFTSVGEYKNYELFLDVSSLPGGNASRIAASGKIDVAIMPISLVPAQCVGT